MARHDFFPRVGSPMRDVSFLGGSGRAIRSHRAAKGYKPAPAYKGKHRLDPFRSLFTTPKRSGRFLGTYRPHLWDAGKGHREAYVEPGGRIERKYAPRTYARNRRAFMDAT